MSENDLLLRLGMALAVGLLIGTERGWHQRDVAEGHRVAGLRTFGLIGLLGGLSATLATTFGPAVLVGAWATLALALLAGYGATVWMHRWMGLTTTTAGLIAFAAGALAGSGMLVAAAAVAVVTSLLLALKVVLHGRLAKLSEAELQALLQLALISVVVLPVLPDRNFGPYAAFNPYRLWWAVVLLSALSFVGYWAMRATGTRRGMALTALLGGLASSTATTAALARSARATPALAGVASASAMLACAVMFARMALLVGVVSPALGRTAVAPLGIMAAISAACGVAGLWRSSGDPLPDPELGNPLDLSLALKFAAFLAVVLLVSRALTDRFGDAGLATGAALAGLADVDAITLSIAQLAREGSVSASIAALAVGVAAFANQISKLGLTLALGSRRMAMRLAVAYGLAALAGAGGWLALR
jgi:uncharacterized membrane protein (DUF4010 family)